MTKKSSISPEEFVLRAIVANKKDGHKGLHTVWSGFNAAFRQHFGDTADPIIVTTQMRKDQKIAVFLVKGGVLLYLRDDLTAGKLAQHDAEWVERDSGDGKPASKKKKQDPDTAGDLLTKILKG